MPGLDQYIADNGGDAAGQDQGQDPMQQQAQPMQAPMPQQGGGGPMSLGSANTLQPSYDNKDAMRTPLNDKLYSGGRLTRILKMLLVEKQQARAAASAQFQNGVIEQNHEDY